MTNFETVDFYTDTSLLSEPHSYFRYLFNKGPVTRLPHRNVVAVTGYDEAIEVMLDTQHFSAVNAATGPVFDLPFEPEGDDITEQLAAARAQMPFSDILVTSDGIRHSNLRSVMSRLFTPSRLKAVEASLHGTADAMIDEFIADGRVDLVRQYGGPYATNVISDLLGIPPKDRARFRKFLEDPNGLHIGATIHEIQNSPVARVAKHIFGHIAKRRLVNHPLALRLRKIVAVIAGRDIAAYEDIMTELALAEFADGTRPSVVDLTGLGAFLYGAGQDTINRLLASAFRLLATRPELQHELRTHPERIPDFIEEMLRYDGPVKQAGRLCIRTTTIGGVEIKAGTTMLISHLAANRDPRRFENPDEFNMDRPRLKEHLGFGRGAHTCIGAPLARSEARVSIERLLARLGNIRLSEAHHGPEGNRRFDYEPTSALNALSSLHLEFDPL